MDRISQLPEPIVHHILSFLIISPTDLVRMSVLSNTWFHLTASFPFLNFYIGNFTSRECFFKYVEYTSSRFYHQNLTAHRLVFIANIREPAELDIVDRCFRLLLKNGIRKLVVDFVDYSSGFPPDITDYRLPDILLSVSALESLSIEGCELPSSLMLDTIKFKSLIYLELGYVHLDDEVIKYLTTSCPLLQVFHVTDCPGFKSFCVYGHQNLLKVALHCNPTVERIDIDAPKLYSLSVIDSHEIARAPQMNLASCKKLTSVYYHGNPLPNSNGFTDDFLSNFPFIENLELVVTSRCNNLKLSSQSLRTLQLRSSCDLEEIDFSTPNLGLFDYSSDTWYHRPVIKPLPHLKACMRCYPDGSIDALWFQKLRRFMEKQNGFKALNLYIRTGQEFIVLEKLKEVELPPYELEHIELHFEDKESSDHAAFVDALLWYFRPRSLTLRSSIAVTDFEEPSDLVKFTCKRLLEQEDQGHTNIQIVSSSSSKSQKNYRELMLSSVPLPPDEKAISFIKEKVHFLPTNFLDTFFTSLVDIHTVESCSQRFAGLEISDALDLGVYQYEQKIL